MQVRSWIVAAGLVVFSGELPANAAETGLPRPAEIPVLTQGDFVFFSPLVFQRPSNEAEAQRRAERLAWIKRFRICLTNGYETFAGRDLEELHAAGCELFIYRWFNGFYAAELAENKSEEQGTSYYRQFPHMVQLFREIYAHPEWVLNHGTSIQGGGAEHPAYFYDYANSDFRRFFVASIQRDLERSQYDGVFFDYIGDWALPPAVAQLWDHKHPDLTYNDAGLRFLQELRAAIGTRRIFGNQAYRLTEPYYDLIDYDASESLATSYVWGKEAALYEENGGVKSCRDTFYRNWDGAGGYEEISRERRARATLKPRVRVCDINYLQPWRVPTGTMVEVSGQSLPVFTQRTDRPAIFYSYAVSKLVGGCVFASDWHAEGYGEDDIYFVDLGEPLDTGYAETPEVVARYFRNGFVAVTRGNGRVVFSPDAKFLPEGLAGLWDTYEGTRVHGWSSRRTVTVFPAYYPSTQRYYPSGRVYVYLLLATVTDGGFRGQLSSLLLPTRLAETGHGSLRDLVSAVWREKGEHG